MSDDYIDFELTISGDRSLPDWMFREDPYQVRAFRSAIEAEYGPIPEGTSLKEAFVAVQDALNRVAEQKMVALEGAVDGPLPLVGPDIL